MTQPDTNDPNDTTPGELTASAVDAGAAALREKLTDLLTPGYQVEFDPEEAEQAGAFEEDALSEDDAAASCLDLADAGGPALRGDEEAS